MNNNTEQTKKEQYKVMLKKSLYHSANSVSHICYKDKMDAIVELIDANSKDLPANEKRCILCNTVAVGENVVYGTCKCGFLGYDHDFDTGKYSRYLIDMDRLEKKDEK